MICGENPSSVSEYFLLVGRADPAKQAMMKVLSNRLHVLGGHMAQGDEGARGARVERGAVRTGRCAAGLALLWFWVPWAAAIAHPL